MKIGVLLLVLLPGTISLAQTAVSSEESIMIGGLKQFITIKGRDKSLPLLLFLHGGPGGSVMNYADKFSPFAFCFSKRYARIN